MKALTVTVVVVVAGVVVVGLVVLLLGKGGSLFSKQYSNYTFKLYVTLFWLFCDPPLPCDIFHFLSLSSSL
jgi:hypothetical protein